MARFDWLSEYLARLQDEHVLVRRGSAQILKPAHVLYIDVEDWGRAGELAKRMDFRWCAIWGELLHSALSVSVCFEYQGDYLILNTETLSELDSYTPYYPIASRMERHMHDMLGLNFKHHPDLRKWTRHCAWPADQYPLRHDFKPAQNEPLMDDYSFQSVQGESVCQIPVGPVHAGIIEPGHFRFNAVGETVLSLEERLGYVHKGIEKSAQGRDAAGLVRLAARISGDCTVAHSWAACQAIERALGIEVSSKAAQIRAVLCERERIANHLGDIGAICNDVGFAFALAQFSRLREDWLRRNQQFFGHRLLMDRLIPGGVNVDLSSNTIQLLKQDQQSLKKETEILFDILLDQPSLEDRLFNTGYLSPATARALGCSGHVGKASGQALDIRASNPYPPYDQIPIKTVCLQEGDVMARVQVRMLEIKYSLDWLDEALNQIEKNHSSDLNCPIESGSGQGLGIIDSWRGEIISYVRLEKGRVERFFSRDPSWHHWPALESILIHNIVPDFPVCNKSVNASYSGHDL